MNEDGCNGERVELSSKMNKARINLDYKRSETENCTYVKYKRAGD